MKKTNYINILFILIGVTVLLFFLQKKVLAGFSETYNFFYPVWQVYLFHFSVTFIILTSLHFIGKKVPNYIGFSFLGFILLKMIAALVFLIPLIKFQNVSKIPDFVSFFIPYFIYLFLEIVLVLRILNASVK